jgi:hypothetical protein
VKEDGTWNDEVLDPGDGLLRGRDGPAPLVFAFEEDGWSIGTISLSCDFIDLCPFTCPFVGGVRDRDRRAGDGIRFSATVVGFISMISSRSSSESEEGKNRSGSLFCRVGAAGEGDGVNCIVDMACLIRVVSFARDRTLCYNTIRCMSRMREGKVKYLETRRSRHVLHTRGKCGEVDWTVHSPRSTSTLYPSDSMSDQYSEVSLSKPGVSPASGLTRLEALSTCDVHTPLKLNGSR